MRQQAAVFFLVAMVAAVALASSAAAGSPMRSRLLAGLGPKNKKCSLDPSVCSYTPGQTCCGDACVSTDTDPLNCGKCGKLCKFTDSCCGGKCMDLSYDKNNCGSCGNRCKKRCFYGLCDYA